MSTIRPSKPAVSPGGAAGGYFRTGLFLLK